MIGKVLKVIFVILGGCIAICIPAAVTILRGGTEFSYNPLPWLTGYIVFLFILRARNAVKGAKTTVNETAEKPKVKITTRKEWLQNVEQRRLKLTDIDFKALRNEPLTLMVNNFTEIGSMVIIETVVQSGMFAFENRRGSRNRYQYFGFDLLIPLTDGTSRRLNCNSLGFLNREDELFDVCVEGDHVSFQFTTKDIKFEEIQRYGTITVADYKVTDDDLARIYRRILEVKA